MKHFPESLEDIEYNLHSFELEFERYRLNTSSFSDNVREWPFDDQASIDKMKNFTKIVVDTADDVFEELRAGSKYFGKRNDKSTLDTIISHIYFEFRRINYFKDRYGRICDPQVLKCLDDLIKVNETFDFELDDCNKEIEKGSGMLLISSEIAKQKAVKDYVTQLMDFYSI